MSVMQISVFLENKPGTLKKMTSVLAANKIDMRATSLAETKDFGIARLVVDDALAAVNTLKENNFVASLTPVLAIEIPEEMGMLRDHTVTEDDLQNGETLRDLHLPHGIRVMMVKRDGKFLVPHGSMQLQEGDHLVIIMGDTDD